MKFLKNKHKNDYTVIIGCGRLGSSLANKLSDKNGNVLIIDKNKDSFKRLSNDFGGLTINADGTDLNVLKEANIENCDSLIVVTNNDNTNILIAQIAKHTYNIKKIIARIYDPQRRCVYEEFGIKTVCPTILSAKKIDELLDNYAKKGEL